MKFWLGVVSKEHVMRGVDGHYIQVCHGKKGPLQRMKSGDWFVYYSPVVTFGGKDKLQAFTAIGQVKTGDVYQVEMFPGFKPFRCDVDFLPCKETPIAEVKSVLSITQGNWGMVFRRGHIEVPEADFKIIASAMNVSIDRKAGHDAEKKRKLSDEVGYSPTIFHKKSEPSKSGKVSSVSPRR